MSSEEEIDGMDVDIAAPLDEQDHHHDDEAMARERLAVLDSLAGPHATAEASNNFLRFVEENVMHAQEGSDFKTVLDFHAAEVISMVARQVDLNRDPAIRVLGRFSELMSSRELLMALTDLFHRYGAPQAGQHADDPLTYSSNAVLITMASKAIHGISKNKHLFAKQILNAVTRLIDRPLVIEDAPTENQEGNVTYAMTNIDPERVQKQEKQVLKKWKSNLEHLLPSLFELLHQLASPGDGDSHKLMAEVVTPFLFLLVSFLFQFAGMSAALIPQIYMLMRQFTKLNLLNILRFYEFEIDPDRPYVDEYGRSSRINLFEAQLTEFAYRPEWSPFGMATLLHHYCVIEPESSDLPLALSREYVTWLLFPHLAALLRYTDRSAIVTAIAFTELVIAHVGENSLVYEAFSEWEMANYHRFVRCFVDQLVRIPEKDLRLRGQKLLFKMLTLFNSEGRYHVLVKLLQDCPYTNINSNLVLTWKAEFLKALDSGDAKAPFLQPRTLQVFWMTLSGNPTDLLNRLEVVLASLNFLHVVFVKCKLKSTNVNIWSAETLQKIKERVLTPWKKLVALHLDKEHSEVQSRESQQRTLDDIQKRGMPALSATELERAQWRNINDLTMVKQILDRIDEVVEKNIL